MASGTKLTTSGGKHLSLTDRHKCRLLSLAHSLNNVTGKTNITRSPGDCCSNSLQRFLLRLFLMLPRTHTSEHRVVLTENDCLTMKSASQCSQLRYCAHAHAPTFDLPLIVALSLKMSPGGCVHQQLFTCSAQVRAMSHTHRITAVESSQPLRCNGHELRCSGQRVTGDIRTQV